MRRELCSAATDTKARAGIGIPACQSYHTAAWLFQAHSYVILLRRRRHRQTYSRELMSPRQRAPYALQLAGHSNTPLHHTVPPHPGTSSFVLIYCISTVSQRLPLCPQLSRMWMSLEIASCWPILSLSQGQPSTSTQRDSTCLAVRYCSAQARDLREERSRVRHHTRHVGRTFSSTSESPRQATATGARRETKQDHRKKKRNLTPNHSLASSSW